MKRLLAALALVALGSAPALAQQSTGGISGYVSDLATGKPMPGVTVLYYKGPWVDENATHVYKVETDKHGFFSDITLAPGRYVVMARVPGEMQACALDDVQSGEVTRLKMEIGHDKLMCTGPRVHPMMVDPNEVGDLYRI